MFRRAGRAGRASREPAMTLEGWPLSTVADRALETVPTAAAPAPVPTAPVPTAPVVPRRSVAATVRAYVALTKPRIVELLLVTTVPAMILAAPRSPDPALIAVVLLGGAL